MIVYIGGICLATLTAKKAPAQASKKSGQTDNKFLKSCSGLGIAVKANEWGRIVLTGDYASVLSMRNILMIHPDTEAGAILELSARDRNLKDLLSEREAILWTEGLPCSPMDAARGLGCGQGWPEDIYIGALSLHKDDIPF